MNNALARLAVTYLLLLCVILSWGGPVLAADADADASDRLTPVRVGVLKFGTVNWELEVIQDMDIAMDNGVDLQVVPYAQKNATTVALQGGAVDMIVSDWLWVSRQRAQGQDYVFVPHSRAVGGIVVRPDAGIDELADLEGKRLGVAGGPADKSWLLLRAYTKQTLGKDLADMVEPVFAAPPLLNELIRRDELPAVLNFWHYGARLKAAGMVELIGVRDVLPALGVQGDLPLLGWVFRESWGEAHRQAVEGFLAASSKAKRLMMQSDGLWDLLADHMGADDPATLLALRDGYREGIVESFGELERQAARQVYDILAREGGSDLVGKAETLSPGTFWTDEQGELFTLVPFGTPPDWVDPNRTADTPGGGPSGTPSSGSDAAAPAAAEPATGEP